MVYNYLQTNDVIFLQSALLQLVHAENEAMKMHRE